MTVAVDLSGSSTSPRGFRAGAAYTGIKTYGESTLDVGILCSDSPCTVAGTFTRARLHSASVDINRQKIADGMGRAVVVNSGCANSSTGQRGIDVAVGIVVPNEDWTGRVKFVRAHVNNIESISIAIKNAREGGAALIESWRRDNPEVACIDGGTAGQQGVRLGRPTVIGQGTKQRVLSGDSRATRGSKTHWIFH